MWYIIYEKVGIFLFAQVLSHWPLAFSRRNCWVLLKFFNGRSAFWFGAEELPQCLSHGLAISGLHRKEERQMKDDERWWPHVQLLVTFPFETLSRWLFFRMWKLWNGLPWKDVSRFHGLTFFTSVKEDLPEEVATALHQHLLRELMEARLHFISYHRNVSFHHTITYRISLSPVFYIKKTFEMHLMMWSLGDGRPRDSCDEPEASSRCKFAFEI